MPAEYEEFTIPLTFGAGVDLKTEQKSVVAPRLRRLENGVFAKGTTIVKRTGYDALASALDTAGALPRGRALAKRGDELVMFGTDGQLYSYRDSSASWSMIGTAISIEHNERTIAKTSTHQTMADAATVNGVQVVAWEDSLGGVWWSVVELTSQRILRVAEQLAIGGTCPRVVHVGERIVVFWLDATGGRILAVPVNPENYLAPVVPVVVTADLNVTHPFYDAMRMGAGVAGAPAVMAWNESGGKFRVGYVDGSGVLLSSPSVVTDANASVGPISVAWIDATTPYGGVVVGVAFTNTGDVLAEILDATNLSAVLAADHVGTGGATPIRIASTFTTDGPVGTQTVCPLNVWAEYAGAIERDNYIVYGSLLTSSSGPYATLRGHGLASRGFTDGIDLATGLWISPNGACVFVAHGVTFFPYAALTRWFDIADALASGRVTSAEVPGPPVLLSNIDSGPAVTCIGRHLVGSSDGVPVRGHLATVDQDEDDSRIWRLPGITREMRSATPGAPTFSETGIQIITLDFDSADAYLTCEFGRDMIVGGACPLRYDGDTIAELGFHTAPDDIAALTETTITPGGLTASSLYTYTACYEGTDAAGEVHQGPMSVPFQIKLTATGTGATIPALPTYRLTGWRSQRIAIFRGVANSTLGADGSVPDMWRITSLDPSATSGDNQYIANDTTIDTVSFHDNMSDLVLVTKEPAYTNAGVLSSDPIGLGHLVLSAKGRLFFNDPTDGEIVRYTQQRRDGYGADVVGDLSIRVPGGAVRALAVLDDAILVFSAHQISFFAGDGPLPNPDAAPQIAFSPPRVVTGDVGCSSPRSMAITPDRVLFDSDRGIYEINRSQQISYIGALVEEFNSSNVLSADPVPGKTQVIFLLDHADQIALLYDYYFGEWSIFTNHGGADGVVVGDLYHYLRANPVDGRVFRQTTGYLDAGLDIQRLVRLSWVKPQGYHQGHVRFWYAKILGEYKSSHKLRVRFAVDYEPGWDAPYDIDVDSNHVVALYGDSTYGDGPYGGERPSDSRYDEQVFVGLEAQALSVEISDIANGSPLGASFELTELILTGCILRPVQLAAANRSH